VLNVDNDFGKNAKKVKKLVFSENLATGGLFLHFSRTKDEKIEKLMIL